MMPQIETGAGCSFSFSSLAMRLGLWLCFVASAMAFDMSLNSNLAVYWGQNSYGAANSGNTADWQQPIEFYCGGDTIDTLPVAFLDEFYSTGNLPSINLANTCSTTNQPVFPGTNLPNCSFLASGIETCQQAGKIVTMSLGGASGNVGFTSDSEGTAYAQTIWDLFLGGSSETRPFGTAVLDGIDMDIEGGTQTGFVSFLTALRSLMDGGSKQYYITAAPQCPFPDSYIGTTLNQFGFDAVYVQFYNNYCGVNNFGDSNDFDFSTWDNWAKNTSPNTNVKVYLGVPASSSAAGSGYVSASTLASIVASTQSTYSSFGGVMLWDASQAYANGRYDEAAKAALTSGSSGSSNGTSPAPTSTSSTPSAPASVSVSASVSVPLSMPALSSASASLSMSSSSSPSPSQSSYSGAYTPTTSFTSSQVPTGVASTTPQASSSQPAATTYSSPTPSSTPTPTSPSPSSQSSYSYSSKATFTTIRTSATTKATATSTSSGSGSGTGTGITGVNNAASPSSTAGSGSGSSASCSGVSAWSSSTIYLGGEEVTYNNQLWTAQWWTEESAPGDSSGVWTLVGSC